MASKSSWGKLRKLPSGKYQASHLAPNGERVNAPLTFITKRQAQAWLAAQQTLIAQGKWRTNQNSQPNDFYSFAVHHIQIQTSSRGKNLHGSTQALYHRLLKLHLAEFHNREIAAVTSQQVERWWQTLVSSGQ